VCHIILTTIAQDMEDVVYLGRDDDMDKDGEIEYGDDEIGSDHTSETSQDGDNDGHAMVASMSSARHLAHIHGTLPKKRKKKIASKAMTSRTKWIKMRHSGR